MRIEYWINDNGWEQIDCDTYHNFTGEKEIRPANVTKLEKLKAQRKEIDKKIRELEHPKYVVDGAKCYLQKYAGSRPDEWLVRLEEIDDTMAKNSAYKQIVSAKSLNDAIAFIETQIAILQNLLQNIRGEEDNNG